MTCNNCGVDQPSNTKFCSNCGTKILTAENNIQADKKVNGAGKFHIHKYWKYALVILIAVPWGFNYVIKTNNEIKNSTEKAAIERGQYYTIQEDGSKIKFPAAPVRSEREITMEDGTLNNAIIYTSRGGSNVYFSIIVQHDENFEGNNPNFSAEGFEQHFQNIVGSQTNSKLVSNEKIIFNGKQAIQFTITADGVYDQGIHFLSGQNIYTIRAVTDESSRELADIFFNSLKLKN